MKESFKRAKLHQNVDIGAIFKVPQKFYNMFVVELPVKHDLLLHLCLRTFLLLEHPLLNHLVSIHFSCPAVSHRIDLCKPSRPQKPINPELLAFPPVRNNGRHHQGLGTFWATPGVARGRDCHHLAHAVQKRGRKKTPQIQFEKEPKSLVSENVSL